MSRGYLMFSEGFLGACIGFLGMIFIGLPDFAEEAALVGATAGVCLAWASRRS
jgi:hypothetical protein